MEEGFKIAKGRVPMQVSPSFKQRLKEIQRKMVAAGNDISLRDLTEEIASVETLGMIEERLKLKKINDINLRLDKRRK